MPGGNDVRARSARGHCTWPRRSVAVIAGALAAATLSCLPPGEPASPAGAAPPPGATTVADPAALVRPLDGTGTGAVSPGTVGEFPGADVPFGMIQWSPDTTPDTVQSGGGYDEADTAMNGFSLTHLSGSGCPSYEDVPILPTVGAIGATPQATTESFSQAQEVASPGRYAVQLGPSPVSVALAVGTRSGIARFDYPASTSSNLLFKVADNPDPVTAASVHVVGHDEVEGQVTSGQFCQTGTNYTLYFVARFDRPFASAGSWDGAGTTAGSTACQGTSCGAFVTFDTTKERQVLMKVGISFVSDRNAAENLAAEEPGWSPRAVATAAQQRWNRVLGRIAITGGEVTQRRIFYTALYHSLLFPNVVSDVNGDYAGSDGRVHVARGRQEYANFSEWDVYRSEIQLESLLVPTAVGDMVQSLVDDATQTGWLPKWAIVGGDESQMNGDSADPIIADAYALGVHNFDVAAALRFMVKGATQTESGHGLEIERQYLSQYLSQHYINAGSLDLTSIDYSIGGSATLEYAIDDFAIAQIATAQHDGALAASMMRRAASWEYLFNPATGYIQARGDDGSFPPGPAFEASQLEPGGQTGFEEGNAVQYTWSVPQDLSALAALVGGDRAATAELDAFFTQLNAGRDVPNDWSGNEPGEWAPWEFDFFGTPEQTQRVVREIADDEYADAPVDEPGNDDLGAISSWYVWAAIGLFPVTPGTADLALASPLFPSVHIALPDGRRLVERAPAAAATHPYVHALEVSGAMRPSPQTSCASPAGDRTAAGSWDLPWLPGSVLTTGATLTYMLSGTPDPSWASSPAESPPSFGTGAFPALGFSLPSGSTSVVTERPSTLELGLAASGSEAATVHWQVDTRTTGLAVTPSSGTMTLGTAGSSVDRSCGVPPRATQTLSLTALSPGSHVLRLDLTTLGGIALPPVVIEVAAQP